MIGGDMHGGTSALPASEASKHRVAFPLKALAVHRVFVVIALMFGAVYAFVTPPNASPDEMAHQTKIARVAGGNLFGSDPDLPMPDVEGWYGTFNNARMSSAPYRLSGKDIAEVVGRPLDCSSEQRDTIDQVTSYSPMLYVPPALAYRLTCRFGGSFGTYLYSARLANLVLCVALIAIGIAISPLMRWPIFYVSLLPSSLYELASVSADAMLIALGMLYLAVVAETALGRIDVRRGIWLVTLLGVAVSFSKPSYYCLSLFGFAVYPALRRARLPFWLTATCLFVLPLLSQGALLLLGFKAATAALPDGIDPAVNLKVLIRHPFRIFPMLARVPSKFPFGTEWNLYESLVGKIGWLTVPLPRGFYALSTLGFVGAAGLASPVPRVLRAVAGFAGLSSVVAISLPLYLYATPITSDVILGLQGRYFLPTAVLLMAACAFPIDRRSSDALRLGTVAVSVALLCASLFRFMHIYYA